MNNNNMILLAAIGAAVLLVLQKQAQAGGMTLAQKQAAGLVNTPAQQQSVNMNGDMWTRLMADGWRNLTAAQYADGSPAFLKNAWGQITTSDGKPIDSGDPLGAYSQVVDGLPVDGTPNYTSDLFPLTASDYLNW